MLEIDINKELQEFWEWANSSIEIYNMNGWNKKSEPFEYHKWDVLIEAVKIIICRLNHYHVDQLELYSALTVMALDNESEEILDFIEESSNDKSLKYIVEIGIRHELYEARWQIAEILGRNTDVFSMPFLEFLLLDSNTYVYRRTLLSISKLNAQKAIEIAKNGINNEDEYIRLVSLRILIEYESSYVMNSIQLLLNDSSKLIRDEMNCYLSRDKMYFV